MLLPCREEIELIVDIHYTTVLDNHISLHVKILLFVRLGDLRVGFEVIDSLPSQSFAPRRLTIASYQVH